MEVLNRIALRPWPLPADPWVMKQVWHDLLFAHWPISISAVRTLIPDALAIDTFEDQAWLGIVPFRMSGVRPRGALPVPGFSSFPELNVRTYVMRDGKPGVWFFSLDAASRLAVWGARIGFHLPYFYAKMRCEQKNDRIEYESARSEKNAAPALLKGNYRPTGEVFNAAPGTLEHFLTERYCLYTVDNHSRLIRCDIHHAPWPLQSADASFQVNTMAAAAGIPITESDRPLLHLARLQEVVVWLPQRLK